MTRTKPWLLVIDPQAIFTDPSSPWGSPMWTDAEPQILALLAAFGNRTIVTRWVAPREPSGSWCDYLAAWPFADVAPSDPLLALSPAFANAPGHRIDEPTFGKWGPALAAITGPCPRLVVAGVSTDCCVLSTVLAAADAGAYLQVAADACAGSSLDNHRAALACLELYPPQVTVHNTASILKSVK